MSRDSNYDHQITVFSPQGRLYQMEYAFKAATLLSGLTGVAVRGKNTAVVVTQKKIPDRLMDPSSVTHLFRITPSIGCLVNGLMPDCVATVQRTRMEAADFSFQYGYPMPIHALAGRMADIAQVSTQSASNRPLACIMLLIGVDDEAGPQVFKVDCAGHFLPFFATATGSKEQEAMNLLEKKVEEMKEYNADDTIRCAILCLGNVLGSDFRGAEIEVGVVEGKEGKFRTLTEDEVDGHLNAIADDSET